MRFRWRATIFYRTKDSLDDVVINLKELADLHIAIENGPHPEAVEKIEIILIDDRKAGDLT